MVTAILIIAAVGFFVSAVFVNVSTTPDGANIGMIAAALSLATIVAAGLWKVATLFG